MRRSRSSAACLLVLVAAARTASAQSIAEGGAFLLLPVGARATALGQAATADGGTTEALFWNPAGLASMHKGEAAIHHFSAFAGNGDALAIATTPSSIGTFGLAFYVLDYGTVPTTLPGGTQVGEVTARNLTLQAAYATEIVSGISAGIMYKLVQFRVDCGGDCSTVPTGVGTTHAVDVGVQWTTGDASRLVIGAMLRNLGFPLQVNNEAQADPLPTSLSVGAKWVPVRPPAGVEGLDVVLLADVQSPVSSGGGLDPAPAIGVESGVRDIVRLRFGYAFLNSEARGPSLGIGLHTGRLGVDLTRTFYASDAFADQEPVHVSLRLAL